jgi:hypothetical protein
MAAPWTLRRAAARLRALARRRVRPAGDAGALDGDTQPGLFIHQRDGRQSLIHLRRAGSVLDEVPTPGGDGGLGANGVGERGGMIDAMLGQSGEVGAGR